MADKHYTFEMTDGKTRNLIAVSTASEEDFQRYARAANRKAADQKTGFQIDPNSAKEHADLAAVTLFVADYRKQKGLKAESTDAERASKAAKIFGKIQLPNATPPPPLDEKPK